jgi:hypothetical protein
MKTISKNIFLKTRACLVCEKEFIIKNSLHSYCSKKCAKRAEYVRNRESYRKYKQTEQYKQKKRVMDKEYRNKNKEQMAIYSKEWREKNKSRKIEMDKQYRLKNKEKINRQRTEKYYADTDFRIAHSLRNRIRLALQKSQKRGNTIQLLGCSIQEFKDHLESLFTEGMSFDNYGKWHIDHILPCSAFDLRNSEEQEICFHFTNLQPLWENDNLSKSDKIISKEV